MVILSTSKCINKDIIRKADNKYAGTLSYISE